VNVSDEDASKLAVIPETLSIIYIYAKIARLRKLFVLPSSGKRRDKLIGPLEIVSLNDPRTQNNESKFPCILNLGTRLRQQVKLSTSFAN
jgi:hypothetical protein